nr:hypothetical protein [Microbacterium esteraromaticum]
MEHTDPSAQPDEARRIAQTEVRRHNDQALQRGGVMIDDEAALVRDVLASVSGFGVLQPLLDDDTVEGIRPMYRGFRLTPGGRSWPLLLGLEGVADDGNRAVRGTAPREGDAGEMLGDQRPPAHGAVQASGDAVGAEGVVGHGHKLCHGWGPGRPTASTKGTTLMALKIFGTEPENKPKPRQHFSDNFVGQLHASYQLDGTPSALEEWRITTGDPEVADRVHELYKGEAPEEWETKSERNLQVFTDAAAIEVIVDGPKAIRQRMILWGNDRKPVYISDGEFILDDNGHLTEDRDPDAELTFQERTDKKAYGANPSAEITFRLADDPDLGIFVLKSNSWGLAHFLAAEDIEGQIEALDGPAILRLKLVPVSFKPKNGPRKGKTVSYTATEIEVVGAAPARDGGTR